jgi:hypothetical protein
MQTTKQALEVLAKYHELRQLTDEQQALYELLEASVLIEAHVPQAFAHGSCSIAWCSRQGRIVGGTLTDGAGNTYPVTADLAKAMSVTPDQLAPRHAPA